MPEYIYSRRDRIGQLHDLRAALERLIEHLGHDGRYSDRLPAYQRALTECRRLLEAGFDQSALTALAHAVPDLFHRHREWTPPQERTAGGAMIDAGWFRELEERLQPVLRAAGILRETGRY